MKITDVSIKRPVFITMVAAACLIRGFMSMGRLGLDLFPNTSFGFVVVNTVYPGASPTEVEQRVADKLEEAVSAINGIDKIMSTSRYSFSQLFVQFELSVDERRAADEVAEKVNAIRSLLPSDAEDPSVVRIDPTAIPIQTFAVRSGRDPAMLRDYVENVVQPALQKISGVVLGGPKKRIVFAEGEEPSVIRAAYAFKNQGFGEPVLVGRSELVEQNMRLVGLDPAEAQLEVINARKSENLGLYVDRLYDRLSRQGYLRRDVQRLINLDRNSFAASMVAFGHADAMVTGVTRNFDQVLDEVLRVIDPAPRGRVMGMSVVLAKGHTLFVADTNVTELPDAKQLVDIAVEAARSVEILGFTPRVAFLAYSSFGNPMGDRSEKIREAVSILDSMGVNFEYEGEMPPDLALDPDKRANYPFMRLTGPANVLIMPAIHSASIATKLVHSLGEATVIGPVLLGLSKPVQICPLSASVSKILNMAIMAAYEAPTRATAG